ncbi:guanylate kinase [Paenibacillus alvei]|uniref:Guanylate kinase n=1 Tax=Paenibacillus alvei TaxID=44250 RepID=A0ABT4GWE1_PAEAL|nr:guanylate kinase [Paenibacillus alvei]MCY9757396.1 guanylate kinase [Paenibacillus alvei]MCY9761027.1 guanylate kinase [Paenibacillus alvei]MCY9767144.1 guanylate kinase [Paenibacillus alvei]
MQSAINEMVLNVVLAGLALLSSYAIYYIRRATVKLAAETKKLGDESQRALAQAAIERVDDIAEKTVSAIEQTIAKELRESVKTGFASKHELTELSSRAYSEIVRQLRPDYMKALHDTIGDTEKYIMSTIESKVLELKGRAG